MLVIQLLFDGFQLPLARLALAFAMSAAVMITIDPRGSRIAPSCSP
jgi:hypothetical protein